MPYLPSLTTIHELRIKELPQFVNGILWSTPLVVGGGVCLMRIPYIRYLAHTGLGQRKAPFQTTCNVNSV